MIIIHVMMKLRERGIYLQSFIKLILLILLIPGRVSGQIPKGVPQPHQNEPPMINSVFDVILYIVFPILLILFLFIWRRRQIKKKREEEERKDD